MEIDCKSVASFWKESLKAEASKNHKKLAIVQVGDNPASNAYIRGKIKDCEEVGYDYQLFKLPWETREDELLTLIGWLNIEEEFNGYIVQLPLPPHINSQNVAKSIDPAKDVDGMNLESDFVPCTPLGIMFLLNDLRVNLSGKYAVVLGRSDIVGTPMAALLQSNDATVAVCHSKTPPNIKRHLLQMADIVISAVGKPGIVTSNQLKDGALVIDVGISRGQDEKLHGDFVISDGDSPNRIDYTPVPGGVGLLTRCALLDNLSRT